MFLAGRRGMPPAWDSAPQFKIKRAHDVSQMESERRTSVRNRSLVVPIPIALMLLAALPACQPRTIPETKPISAPATRTGFDGPYTGFLQVIGHGGNTPSGWCETTSTFPLQITNSQFELLIPHPNVPGNSTIVFQVHITPTGRLTLGAQKGVSLCKANSVAAVSMAMSPASAANISSMRCRHR